MHRIVLALLLALPVHAQQQPVSLTFEDALERARQSAPAILAARMRVDEARGRLTGSSLRTNPTLAVETGRRGGEGQYAFEVAQDLDLPQRRRARIDAARAGVTQEEQRAREAEREALREIATTFLRALEAHQRTDAAESSKRIAEETLRIAERRYAAGDVAQLDVNLARTAVARTDADMRAASAVLAGLVTRLQVLLGSEAPIAVAGSLRDARPLVLEAADRPDVRLLEAEIAEAEADARLARTLRWPDVGLRASYGKEEGERVVLGGVGLTLPLFQRGQDALAIAGARLARLRSEHEARSRAIDAEVRGAAATYEALRAAVSEYERTVLALVDENEQLALESYEAGQIGLGDLLLVRREALDARRVAIDQLIEMRLAEVALRTATGVWK